MTVSYLTSKDSFSDVLSKSILNGIYDYPVFIADILDALDKHLLIKIVFHNITRSVKGRIVDAEVDFPKGPDNDSIIILELRLKSFMKTVKFKFYIVTNSISKKGIGEYYIKDGNTNQIFTIYL